MEIILSPRCKSFTGTISRYHGYAVRRSSNRFFSYRTPGKHAKPDGHWQFIVSCAEIAKLNLHIADIKVSKIEVLTALRESGRGDYLWKLHYPSYLHATDVLNLKQELGL